MLSLSFSAFDPYETCSLVGGRPRSAHSGSPAVRRPSENLFPHIRNREDKDVKEILPFALAIETRSGKGRSRSPNIAALLREPRPLDAMARSAARINSRPRTWSCGSSPLN